MLHHKVFWATPLLLIFTIYSYSARSDAPGPFCNITGDPFALDEKVSNLSITESLSIATIITSPFAPSLPLNLAGFTGSVSPSVREAIRYGNFVFASGNVLPRALVYLLDDADRGELERHLEAIDTMAFPDCYDCNRKQINNFFRILLQHRRPSGRSLIDSIRDATAKGRVIVTSLVSVKAKQAFLIDLGNVAQLKDDDLGLDCVARIFEASTSSRSADRLVAMDGDIWTTSNIGYQPLSPLVRSLWANSEKTEGLRRSISFQVWGEGIKERFSRSTKLSIMRHLSLISRWNLTQNLAKDLRSIAQSE